MIAHQAPLSVEFFRQEYWIILGNTSPGELSNPGNENRSLALQAGSLLSAWPGKLTFNIIEPFSKWATWRTFKSLCGHLYPDLFFWWHNAVYFTSFLTIFFLIPNWSVCCCLVVQSCVTLQPHELQHTRLPCLLPSLWVCSNSCPLSWWC